MSVSVRKASVALENEYTMETITQNDGQDGRPFWVYYKNNVYDLTQFKKQHPGGTFIDQAGGGDIEPFWNIWRGHFRSEGAQALLEKHRIGNLAPTNDVQERSDLTNSIDPYINEPTRQLENHQLISVTPLDSETKRLVVGNKYLTSVDDLYVRNHSPVPYDLDPNDHTIWMGLSHCSSGKEVRLSDFGRFDKIDVISVLQCAGNRQKDDFHASGPNAFTNTANHDLDSGQVGNVKWSGYCLQQILETYWPEECRQELESPNENHQWHVIFTGVDEYESSIPLEMIFARPNCMLGEVRGPVVKIRQRRLLFPRRCLFHADASSHTLIPPPPSFPPSLTPSLPP